MKANHWLYQLSVHHRTALNVWSVTSNRSVTLQGIGNASPRPAPTPTESDLWDQNPRSSFSNFAWKSRCWHWSLKRTTLVWYVFQYTHVSNLTLYTLNLNNVIYVDYISIKLGGKKLLQYLMTTVSFFFRVDFKGQAISSENILHFIFFNTEYKRFILGYLMKKNAKLINAFPRPVQACPKFISVHLSQVR